MSDRGARKTWPTSIQKEVLPHIQIEDGLDLLGYLAELDISLEGEGGLETHLKRLDEQEDGLAIFINQVEENLGEITFRRSIFRTPVLGSLLKMGGSGARPDVSYRVELKMRRLLTATRSLKEHYYGTHLSDGVIVWQKETDLMRNQFREEGLISGAQWGMWQLTYKGFEAAENLNR